MTTLLIILHVLVSLFLIFIVLIQGGKGAELGAAFGAGSSQTVFGGRGAATFLNKMTTVVAVVFMLTSLLLAIVSVRGGSVVKGTGTTKAIPSQPAETLPGPVGPQIPQQEPLAPTPTPPPAQ